MCDEILGGAAFQKKKIKHITSKHLGKFISHSFTFLCFNCFTALASNCVSFIIDEVPFVQSQMAILITQEEQMGSLERESKSVTEELQSHIMGIQEQLMKILQNNWAHLLQTSGPSQADFDLKIEKGQTV